jgi:hypothetical protein
VDSARGSSFVLCALAAEDPRFPKYPRLPVIRCAGYERRAGADPRAERAYNPGGGDPGPAQD